MKLHSCPRSRRSILAPKPRQLRDEKRAVGTRMMKLALLLTKRKRP